MSGLFRWGHPPYADFFTLQANIFAAVVFAISAFATFSGRGQSKTLVIARGTAATYLIIVGIVYNTVLVNSPGGGGVALPWANHILHIAAPLYVAVDWVLVGDRNPLPWKRFGVVLTYPIIWLVVVLIRGATDGWVPYPFLDPATGYGSVAIYAVLIAVGFGIFGSLIWALSPVRLLKPSPPNDRRSGLRAG